MKLHKKLIEVALPLDAINSASARDKLIRHGHPSALHLWWARSPLATARAVIFAQMVDDPSSREDLSLPEQDQERQRLFGIIERLVQWENTTNEIVLEEAREEIRQSWKRACADNADDPRASDLFDPDKLPVFHDPFAGGGSLPLEAQRLGLEAYASDLNPVAVLINKAMIEIPPKFDGRPPVNPDAQAERLIHGGWKGAAGLAEDVRYYGKWMRDQAECRIKNLYPKIKVTAKMVDERPDLKGYLGRELTVIAWLWARTVRSPNPAFADTAVPLISSFMLSTKRGKEAYVEPVIKGNEYRFKVRVGVPSNVDAARRGTKLSRGANFECLLSGSPMAAPYIKSEGMAGRIGARLMAIVAEGDRGRVYLAPTKEHELVAGEACPQWSPDHELPGDPRAIWCPLYGLTTFSDLFTDRQLVALNTFVEQAEEARARIKMDAAAVGLCDDGVPLRNGGTGASAYAEAVGIYLSFLVDQMANHQSTICSWHINNSQIRNTFSRQAIPMTWDYAESNPFCNSTGSFNNLWDRQVKSFSALSARKPGTSSQLDARTGRIRPQAVCSTDPPYYDNIGYADLSDFFYVWLRRSLREIFPDLFATLAVPKSDELIASPYRHENRNSADEFFLNGMTQAMRGIAEQANPGFPVTVYYAFRQAEKNSGGGMTSTGWETFLDGLIGAGFAVTGTWPITMAMRVRQVAMGTNALASYIVLACRRRSADAPIATLREFVLALRAELPNALSNLQRGNIAPVDLAQAAIGPGMAIYTRYDKVLAGCGRTGLRAV